MDWTSGFMGAFAPQVQPQEDVEDDEDFYGYPPSTNANGLPDTTAGAQEDGSDLVSVHQAAATSNFPSVLNSADERKKEQEESQKRLESLRARLLAKRAGSSRPETPAKTAITAQPPPPAPIEPPQENTMQRPAIDLPADDFGLESLLAEGKAAAEAETARKQGENTARIALGARDTILTRDTAVKEDVKPTPQPASTLTNKQQPQRTDQETPRSNTNTRSALPPVNLSDPYYDDLPVWLEFTGYHDQAFRDSKLGTYKQRKKLEQEAARIAQELEKLKQAETTDLESLRATSAHPNPAPAMAPPPLPSIMPTSTGINGKRPRSPEASLSSEKTPRRNGDNGFRIRGADDSATTQLGRNGSPVERRLIFPDRRRSLDDRDRDSSLERRQRNYRRDGDGPSDMRHESYKPAREPPRPFNRGEREREREPRPSFSNANVPGGQKDSGRQYRGSSGLDLRKGGVRYFMIKSWNHDNVLQAMKDDVWATQEKNERLLSDAFRTSRHVILLFSVNRSMAFQGYALMTSPPDPALRKPTFCDKLNWGTSSAFSLRWLATTPVHFRMVGHLKNTCNPDEEGQPRAVLVGKDGQEISQEAGMGVVWILDEVEEVETKRTA